MNSTARAVVAVLLLVSTMVACGSDDKGDIEAFCALAREGVGMRPTGDDADLAQLTALERVAPPNIRSAVTTVANASREVDEIQNLRELFRRAFALEEAVAEARDEIRDYTQQHCSPTR